MNAMDYAQMLRRCAEDRELASCTDKEYAEAADALDCLDIENERLTAEMKNVFMAGWGCGYKAKYCTKERLQTDWKHWQEKRNGPAQHPNKSRNNDD